MTHLQCHGTFDGVYCRRIVVGNCGHFPILQVVSGSVSTHLGGDEHLVSNTLEILDGTTKVDTAHAFNKDNEHVTLLYRGECD